MSTKTVETKMKTDANKINDNSDQDVKAVEMPAQNPYRFRQGGSERVLELFD